MLRGNLLCNFDYAVILSASLTSPAKNAPHPVAEHLPLLQVQINFKDGIFILDGDWHFIMISNNHAEPWWFSFYPGRIRIEANIYPSSAIDLDDHTNNGLVFSLDGIIKDGNHLNSCSGLLLLDKIITRKEMSNHEWNISFYLYNYEVDNCEIKFKLPVYTTTRSGNSN